MLSKYCNRVSLIEVHNYKLFSFQYTFGSTSLTKKYMNINMNLNFICHMKKENLFYMSISKTRCKLKKKIELVGHLINLYKVKFSQY